MSEDDHEKIATVSAMEDGEGGDIAKLMTMMWALLDTFPISMGTSHVLTALMSIAAEVHGRHRDIAVAHGEDPKECDAVFARGLREMADVIESGEWQHARVVKSMGGEGRA